MNRYGSARVLRQSLVSLAGMVSHKSLNFLLVFVLARGLGPEEFGTYSYVGVLLLLVGFVSDLGLERVLARELARQPERVPVLIANALALRFTLGVVTVLVGLVVAWLLALSSPVLACYLLGLAVFPLSFAPIGRAYFQSRLQMDRLYALTLASSLLFLALVGICLWMQWPLVSLFAAGLVNSMILSGVILALLLREGAIRWSLHRDVLRLMVGDGLQLGTLSFLFLAAMRVDQVLLFRWRDAHELALYAAGVRLAEAFALLSEAAMVSLLPMMAASFHSRPERYRRARQLAFRYLAVIAVPVVFSCVWWGETMLGLIFGEPFRAGAPALAFLGANMFFAFLGSVFLNEFLIARWLRSMLLVSALAVAANIGLNLFWIPAYGAAGAGAATLASSVLGFCCWFFLPNTRATVLDAVGQAWRPVLAGIATWPIPNVLGAGTSAALVAAGAYVSLLAAFGAVTAEDGKRWMAALKGVRPPWFPNPRKSGG